MVGQRTREIGIRIALGARAHDIFRDVVAQGLWLSAVGAAIGLMGSFGLSRFLSSLLFEIEPGDPLTLVSATVLLGIVAILASTLPARRAAAIDPAVVLRNE